MELIQSYINSNSISQIDIPRYGPANDVPYEFDIPAYFVSHNKKVVVCLPDSFSIKLSYEYMKSAYPEIRTGYGDMKNIGYNLSTQINYITQRFLKYKILQYFQDNIRFENFADVIIVINPNMNDDVNIFNISTFKYANSNNITLPSLCILNSEFSFKLTNKRLFYTEDKQKLKCFNVNQINMHSMCQNISDIINSNYHNYTHNANFLVYVENLKVAVKINNVLKTKIKDCTILIISSDYHNSPNNFSDIFTNKTKKIIIAVNLGEFYFQNIDIVINPPKLLTERKYTNKISKEEYIKSISNLVVDYVKCDISLNKLAINSITNKFEKINIKNVVDSMKNLNLLINNDDKLLVSASGIFFETLKLSPKKSCFLWNWLLSGHSLYQGLIIISLIQENFPAIDLSTNCKWMGKSSIHMYLNMFKSFTEDNDITDIIKNYDQHILACKKWALDNKIQYDKFLTLISNISKLYKIIINNLRSINIDVRTFDVDDVVRKSSVILSEVYFLDILIVKNNNIIQPHNNVKYLLNRYHFNEALKDNKIIPLLFRPVKNKILNDETRIVYIDNFIII
jgi:hypothetical protein